MEDKNVSKISLSTFLLIIAIIAIVIMGVFIYKLDNEKTIETQKSTSLQAQVNNLNGTVSDLNGKINSNSNKISSENIANTTNKVQNEKSQDNKFIADTTVPNPETIFNKQIPLINYSIEYLGGSIDGVDCKKIDYTEYSKLLIDNGFKYGENLKEWIDSNKELIKDRFYNNYSTTKYKFYRYYDNNEKYIVDLRIDENNYIEAIKILTDDSHQGY